MYTEVENQIFNELKIINKRLDSHDKKIDAIDKKFDAIDKKFDAIDKRFDSMDKRLDNMDERFEKIEHALEVIRDSIVIIEHQVTTEIPTLFDAYSLHQEIQDIQQSNINSLNNKVEDHDIRISILEHKTV